MTTEAVFSRDLAGIEVGETAISEVNGSEGTLTYRGYPIDELVKHSFPSVVWLVLFGDWPSAQEEKNLTDFMAEHARLDKEEVALLEIMPRDLHPMLMLQGIVPLLQLKPRMSIDGLSATALKGLLIAAKIPSLIATFRQLETGNEMPGQDRDLGFHGNFLKAFTGNIPSDTQIQTLDATQILQMEHGYNAGTFAGRVCASTKAPIQSSISASIGTLFGVLHGGADQAALEMAEEVGSPENASEHVQNLLNNKKKIMGMGHREYKVVDPRAVILKPMAKRLCDTPDSKRLYETLVAIEEACQLEFEKDGKSIWANVEFYKGAVFHSLGIPSHYFTALFAMARVYGYIAHYLEFSQDSRLIRPKARYVGK